MRRSVVPSLLFVILLILILILALGGGIFISNWLFFLLLLLWWRRAELDGILDGIVYAGMVGIGFAFTENILYLGGTYNGTPGMGDSSTGHIGEFTAVFVMRCLFSLATADATISLAEESEIHRIASLFRILPHDLTALRLSHSTYLPGLTQRPR